MPDQLQLRGGTTAQHTSFTGASKEVTVDTTKKTAVVHDGSTAGGNPLLREDGSNSALSLGSAGTPSLKFTGDTNTGIYSPGADQVAISTGGSGRLFVDSTGKVGIGASPTQLFQLGAFGGNDSNLQFAANTAGASNILFGDGSSGADFYRGFIKYNHATDSLELFASSYSAIYTNGSERLRIDSSGRVGIGTSSPTADLHVVGTSILFRGGSGTASRSLELGSNAAAGGSALSDILLATYGGSHGVRIRGTGAYDYNVGTTLTFGTQPTGGGGIVDRLTITSAGLVGIGATPSYQLEVAGPSGDNIISLFRSGDATAANNAGGGFRSTSSATATSRLAQVWLDADGANLSGGDYFAIQKNGNSGTVDFNQFSNAAMTFLTNNTERARIDSSGRLLVGTSSVSIGTQLEVANTTGSASAFVVSAQSDYAVYCHNKATSGDNNFIRFGTEASFTARGTVTYNRAGGVVAYNTTSDYRAKTILGDLANPGGTIDALKVYRGVMNGATIERPMLVAHEAQEVAPYCVTGEKDAVDHEGNPVYQQIDHQVLVPLLIAEIQQLRARVAALEAQ